MDFLLQSIGKLWPLFMENPLPFLFVATIIAIGAWRTKAQLSKSEIQGLKARTAVMREHLEFAKAKIADLTENLNSLRTEIPRLTHELREARQLPQASREHLSLAIERAIETAASVQGFADKAGAANLALSDALTEFQDPVFEKILGSTDELLTGMIAYGLFRQSEKNWLEGERKQGRKPTAEEISLVETRMTNPSEIARLLEGARKILHGYASAIEHELKARGGEKSDAERRQRH
jgi:hypothetical protein